MREMKTTRRNLFKMLGLGAAAVAAPSVVPAKQPIRIYEESGLPETFQHLAGDIHALRNRYGNDNVKWKVFDWDNQIGVRVNFTRKLRHAMRFDGSQHPGEIYSKFVDWQPKFSDNGKRLPQSFIEHWEKRAWRFVPKKWN